MNNKDLLFKHVLNYLHQLDRNISTAYKLSKILSPNIINVDQTQRTTSTQLINFTTVFQQPQLIDI
jgi:hypothetical protein